ncbi:MAG: DUF3375 domain-containing protein [Spirochaetaceae bacterium]|jgi:hypothetical protein|nr:DUF3375 domain-containing protein [Spirochaetaceae bacterium]
MALDYSDLSQLRKSHPSWRLMNADNGPLIISFFDRVFREQNLRQINEDELILQLEDYLFGLRDGLDEDPFPRSAGDYLEDWTGPGREWLRKFYPPDSDIPHYDLTPGTERVLQWLDGLFGSAFIGTESRLNTCFDLLKQIIEGIEEDKDLRIRELEAQKKRINQEIRNIKDGHIPIMDQRQIRERFLQFRKTARELLSDFRSVEQHFRALDMNVREQIASWEGEKGTLLEQFFGSHDQITQSDEGQSFRAFWDFLMSPSSQEELTRRLDRIYELEALDDLLEDHRLKRIHFDWMAAGQQTQRTVARLSKQLRRYLDDRAFWENRRITEILDNIEKRAVEIKGEPPIGEFMKLEGFKVRVNLPMAQPLFSPPVKTQLISKIETAEEDEIDAEKLFNLVYIDKERLLSNIEKQLEKRNQVSLQEIIQAFPLEQGLAELITYVNLAEKDPMAVVQEESQDRVSWTDDKGIYREASFPQIIFNKRSVDGSERS